MASQQLAFFAEVQINHSLGVAWRAIATHRRHKDQFNYPRLMGRHMTRDWHG
jgi:hypothetical protein